jgi:predicted O-methyltransferase YrrM
MTTLTSPPIGPLLHRLFASAEQNDEKVMATWRAENAHRREQISSRQRADELSDAYLPISPEVGRLLYVLARNKQPRTIVEFGTSFGISTIHLAAAVRDNRNNGRLITTELSAKKANRARQNVAEAGLSDVVEIREGDAFETLRGEVGEPIELLLLDGWKELYLPLLKLLESRLSAGALIIADDLNIAAEALESYLQYVRDPLHGYVSVEVPLDDGLEVSLRCKGRT